MSTKTTFSGEISVTVDLRPAARALREAADRLDPPAEPTATDADVKKIARVLSGHLFSTREEEHMTAFDSLPQYNQEIYLWAARDVIRVLAGDR